MTWADLKRELQSLGLSDEDEIACIRWEGSFNPKLKTAAGGSKIVVNGFPSGPRAHAPFQSPHRGNGADIASPSRPYLIYFYDVCVGEVAADCEDSAIREYVRRRGGNEVGLSAYPAQIELQPSADPATTVTV